MSTIQSFCVLIELRFSFFQLYCIFIESFRGNNEIKKEKRLNVVLLNSPSTYYIGTTSAKGFEYDLLKNYSEFLGVELNITVANTTKEAIELSKLKNITEHLSVIEEERIIHADVLQKYLPDYYPNKLPALYKKDLVDEKTFATEREILYKILFDMKSS